jgi:murein DD-endopeptidase MepM/ murein hydrolase activator NlpD
MIRFVSKSLLLLCLSGAFLVPFVSAEESWSMRWEPSQLVNGSPIVFEVAAPVHLKSLSGKWLDHEVYFAFDPHIKKWYGIAGVSLETKDGTYLATLIGITSRGTELSFERKIAVGRASYPSIAVTVPKQFTEPSAEQLQKIAEDKTLKQDVFNRVNPLREWSGKFAAPANARTSDVFGTQRTFNGQVQSTHQGLDYAVPEGTPVAALNSGTVLVARPMFFEGNCVVLDHGQGLLTIYMHLSEFKIKEGEHVARGEIVGLSGGTGRATGPHLHVAVRWEGMYLDPAILLKLAVP